jgi:hypothetical protein
MCCVLGAAGMIIMRGNDVRMSTGVRSGVTMWPVTVMVSPGDVRVMATPLVPMVLVAVLVFVRVHGGELHSGVRSAASLNRDAGDAAAPRLFTF